MNKMKNLIPIYSVMVIGIFSLIGCGSDMLTAPGAENDDQTAVSIQIGVPIDQLKLVPLKREYAEQLRQLTKHGYEEKLVTVNKGGTVGGKHTLKNKVKVPSNALEEDTWISVNVECIDDNDDQCGATVEFLPSMQFLLDVTVTLSYDILDFDGDPATLKVMWYDETTGLWVEVEDPKINKKQKTVSVQVDHFTRYSWSL